ncbi:MAG: methyltransferase [Flavisolibacter sp.]|jgi:tRNA1Val (adenine37-N6)-methyltransferase|nr:methyltransferase [Flavisolibacter sp.]
MGNTYFKFKQFTIHQERSAMKVTTDACLFGAWVASQLEDVQGKKLLDIGAGTGLISLMIAQKYNCKIDAVEIDAAAALEAKKNIDETIWMDRIELHHQNILQFHHEYCYNFIVSNPPFYENELQSGRDEKDKAHHSKELKLVDVFQYIKKNLEPTGLFFLLLPYKRKNEIISQLAAAELFMHRCINIHHSNKHQPTRILVKGGHQYQEIVQEDFYIRKEDGSYTEAFKALLRDYYLEL